jgi:hypothetical protein
MLSHGSLPRNYLHICPWHGDGSAVFELGLKDADQCAGTDDSELGRKGCNRCQFSKISVNIECQASIYLLSFDNIVHEISKERKVGRDIRLLDEILNHS